METKTIITVIYWLLLVGFLLITYFHGFQKIFATKQKVEMFAKLGYSIPAMRFIGFIEAAGASLLFFPQTRLFIIPIYAVLLSGAVYTHFKSGDDKSETMGPIIAGSWLAVVLILTCWI